jgi:DNA-binding GntR family transcriptional regulator
MNPDTAQAPAPDDSAAAHGRWRGVADRMAQDIQTGLLAPGAWLKQIDLERRYGCSRGDVRRALDELVAKRLVQHVPNRGHHVFELDKRRSRHLTELRAILEGAVAELIYDRADAAALDRLQDLAAGFEAAVEHGTKLDQHGANIAFHMALLDLCPNPELARAVRETRSRLPSALLDQWTTRGWIAQSVRDHAEMLDALRARDRTALREIFVRHLRL